MAVHRVDSCTRSITLAARHLISHYNTASGLIEANHETVANSLAIFTCALLLHFPFISSAVIVTVHDLLPEPSIWQWPISNEESSNWYQSSEINWFNQGFRYNMYWLQFLIRVDEMKVTNCTFSRLVFSSSLVSRGLTGKKRKTINLGSDWNALKRTREKIWISAANLQETKDVIRCWRLLPWETHPLSLFITREVSGSVERLG